MFKQNFSIQKQW